MVTIDRQIPVSGSIWQCEQCHIWWGSQVGEHPLTLFLLRLPEHLRCRFGLDRLSRMEIR
jgi:hypothetical protein